MKIVTASELGGTIIRDNDTYTVEDNTFLDNLVLSKTKLNAGKETAGHKHDGLEEVYYFIFSNKGVKMQIDDEIKDINQGDIVLIPAGAFHKVYNEGEDPVIFLCVFQKYERED